jgi:signal transduction histidine kinase
MGTRAGPPRTLSDLQPGDYVGCLYQTEAERQSVLAPLIGHGLAQGDRLLCIAEDGVAQSIVAHLRDAGLDAAPYLASRRLVLHSAAEAGSQESLLGPARLRTLLQSYVAQALADGYPALRVVVDLTRQLGETAGAHALIEYSTHLHDCVVGRQCLLACLYAKHLATGLLRDVMRTHPILVLNTQVYDNPYCLTLDEQHDDDLEAVELQHWLRHLTGQRASADTLERRSRELQAAQEKTARRERLVELGQLAGEVSHELRSPLGTIKNLTFLLNMILEGANVEVRDALRMLDREVGRAEKIIGQLLDLGRSRAPALCLVSANEVVREALARSGTTLDKRIVVTTELDDSLPAILADPDQLDQVLENLIVNAVQAMPDGGRLTLTSAAASPDWIAVRVTDTGVGIAADDLPRIFDPLFTTKMKGMGLGLTIARNLVEGLGGMLEVRSEPGHGTTFVLRLPVGTATDAPGGTP